MPYITEKFSVSDNSSKNNQKRQSTLDGPDHNITSALSEIIKSVPLQAGQTVPVSTWKLQPNQNARINIMNPTILKSPNSVQNVMQKPDVYSDSASKVAEKQVEMQRLTQQLYQAEYINQKRQSTLDGPDRNIISAVSETIKSVPLQAGQTVPVSTWKPKPNQNDSISIMNPTILKNPNSVKNITQKPAVNSDSASKVAEKQVEMQRLTQQLYQAENILKREVGEVTRSQQIAAEAVQVLEEATNKVCILSSNLQAAQDNAATCAMRMHTARAQLAEHDQLVFTARQCVHALSARIVYVQAELALEDTFVLNESCQYLKQQGRLNNIYQFKPGVIWRTGNDGPPSAAAVAAASGLPGQVEQQKNQYPIF